VKKLAALLALAAIATPLTAATTTAAGVDPLTADIDIVDAQRFAGLMKDGALPTAEVLQRGYLDGAGRGVRIFTPNRIVDAANLARVVAARQDNYRQAIRECLPQLPALRSDLRAIYLGFAGLVPERPLPAIHVVFGASNSGGTADSEAQVIGLEVVCKMGATPDKFRAIMRDFFAHETVHTWQRESSPQGRLDPLLDQSLREGVADYLASLVTGQTPDTRRDAWAREREAWLWQEFQRDRQALKADSKSLEKPGASPHYLRWLSNYGSAPEGWPYEAGYWIGMRIAEAYVARARDKHAAIRDLIEFKDPNAILEASGYGS